MAVTLTTPELAVALGIVTTGSDGTVTVPTDQNDILDRIRQVATALVEQRAPNAPVAVQNEATVRCAGWMYDSDPAQVRYTGNIMANSGAAAILAPWRVQSLIAPRADAPDAPAPSGGAPPGGWPAADLAAAVVARLLPPGGAGGGIVYRDASDVLRWLASGDSGSLLALDSDGVPHWQAGGGVSSINRLTLANGVLTLFYGSRAGSSAENPNVAVRLWGAGGIGAALLDDTVTVRLLPAPEVGHAGRIVQISSQGEWVATPVEWDIADLAAAVLARMAPDLTGQGGKFLAIRSDASAVEAVDPPSGGQGGPAVDATARAAATAAQETADDAGAQARVNAEAVVGLMEQTRNIRKVTLPGTWAAATDAKIVARQATSTEVVPATPTGDIWSAASAAYELSVVTPTGAGDETTPRVAVVIQLPTGADPDDYRIRRLNVAADGAQAAGIISSSRWRPGLLDATSLGYPSGFDYREPIIRFLGDFWTGGTITWTIEKHSKAVTTTEWDGTLKDGIAGLAALASAVLARMAPALTGNGGKFLAINSGATAVEAVAVRSRLLPAPVGDKVQVCGDQAGRVGLGSRGRAVRGRGAAGPPRQLHAAITPGAPHQHGGA